jgi:transcriptional regulator with XRE-family HTH domain
MKTKDFTREAAARIKLLREHAGLSQAECAKKLRIKQAGYSKIELGIQRLTGENCVHLADLFSVSCDFILRGNYEVNATMFAEETLKKASEMIADVSTLLFNSSERMVVTSVKPFYKVPY